MVVISAVFCVICFSVAFCVSAFVFYKTNVSIKYDDFDLMFGPVLRKEKSPLFVEKWTKVLNDYKRIIEKSSLKPIKLLEECKMIEDVL